MSLGKDEYKPNPKEGSNKDHPLKDNNLMGKLISLEDQIANNNYDLMAVEEIIKIYSVF